MHILETIYFGDHYFQTVVLLRNAFLVSVLTNNSEIWFNISIRDMQSIESVDYQLISRALSTHSKTSTCLMMLEMGLAPIRFIIKMKRLNYLHHLLNTNEDSIPRQILFQQMKKPYKNDWIPTVQEDLNDFGINMSLDQITSTSKNNWKKIVKKACIDSAYTFLIQQKSKLSKGKEIIYKSLQMQNYLKAGNGLTVESMKNIFYIRSRNLQLKCNFPLQYSDRKCIVAECDGEDSQIGLFTCNYFAGDNTNMHFQVKYEDIFSSNVPMQAAVMNILMERYERRLLLLSPQPTGEGDPVDRCVGSL